MHMDAVDAYLEQTAKKRARSDGVVLVTETIPALLITNHAWMMDSHQLISLMSAAFKASSLPMHIFAIIRKCMLFPTTKKNDAIFNRVSLEFQIMSTICA